MLLWRSWRLASSSFLSRSSSFRWRTSVHDSPALGVAQAVGGDPLDPRFPAPFFHQVVECAQRQAVALFSRRTAARRLSGPLPHCRLRRRKRSRISCSSTGMLNVPKAPLPRCVRSLPAPSGHTQSATFRAKVSRRLRASSRAGFQQGIVAFGLFVFESFQVVEQGFLIGFGQVIFPGLGVNDLHDASLSCASRV